jgi:hypothetical protein
MPESAAPSLPALPTADEFVEKYVSQPQFDPSGFWFITERYVLAHSLCSIALVHGHTLPVACL